MARVIATEQVTSVHRRGLRMLEIGPHDIVTAQARDTAEALGVALIDGPLENPLIVRSDGATAMRRGLLRRNPGWLAPQRKSASELSATATPINHLALIGAGGVGASVAQLVAANNGARSISLVDITPGLAASIALDLNHASGISRATVEAVGGQDVGLIKGANVVVVSAGRPRTPGMSRADLLQTNSRIVRTAAEAIRSLAPNAVVIVVSNPLDEMTHEVLRATGFPRQRVIGMAGTLDSSRFRRALARAAGLPVADIEAITLGSHGEEMVPVVSRARIRGRGLSSWLNEQQINDCVQATVAGGAAVVSLRKTGSATVAPAHATVELLDHLRGARAGAVPASVLLQGEYGIEDVVLGVPCVLGSSGLLQVDELALSEEELQGLRQAAESIRLRLGT